MGTAVRLDPGARLYRDLVSTYSCTYLLGTVIARVSPDPHATIAILDIIQGSNSVVGRSNTIGIMGSWNHGTTTVHDGCTLYDYDTNTDPYHSFYWLGLVDGFLHLEVFDGRPLRAVSTGPLYGSGTNLVVQSPARIPTAPACAHIAVTVDWPNVNGGVGTYTLFVDGVAVASGTTNPCDTSGTGTLYYSSPSFSVGTAKDGYRPQVGSCRLMNLRGSSTKYTAAQLLSDAQSPCAVLLSAFQFDYPFNGNILANPPNVNRDFTLDAGTIDLTVPDCCPSLGGATLVSGVALFPPAVWMVSDEDVCSGQLPIDLATGGSCRSPDLPPESD